MLVDLGHHAQGVNIEQIVAFLLDEGKLGGFHFNNRKYADDDLIVGTVNPYELFLIYNELVDAEQSATGPAHATANNVAYMIDQSHTVEGKLAPMIYSVLNCQEAYAKALLVPRAKLADAQAEGDVLGAHASLTDAFRTTCARCSPSSAKRWACRSIRLPPTGPAATKRRFAERGACVPRHRRLVSSRVDCHRGHLCSHSCGGDKQP